VLFDSGIWKLEKRREEEGKVEEEKKPIAVEGYIRDIRYSLNLA